MINKKTVQLSVVLNERVYDDVKKLAIKKRTSMGNIIRSFAVFGDMSKLIRQKYS